MFAEFYVERIYDMLWCGDYYEKDEWYCLLKVFYPELDQTCEDTIRSSPAGREREMLEITIQELANAFIEKYEFELIGDVLLALDILSVHYCHVADENTFIALLAKRGELYGLPIREANNPTIHNNTKGGFSCTSL